MDLGFIKIGSFKKEIVEKPVSKKVNTNETFPDACSRAINTFSDLPNVKVISYNIDPYTTEIVNINKTEIFKGIILGNKIKIGSLKTEIQKKVQYNTKVYLDVVISGFKSKYTLDLSKVA